jgi:hypothetical protein
MEKIDNLMTVESVEEYRKKLNEACDTRVAYLEKMSKAAKLSESGFGSIKENMENISHLLFSTKEGGALLGKYQATIKNSNALSSMHTLYEGIRKANSSSDISFFINEIANQNWGVNKNELNEGLKKLGEVIGSAYIMLGKDADEFITEGNKKLDEAVEYIATTPKTKKNIAEYSNAVKVIREQVENAKPVETAPEYNELVREFNEKYEGKLTKEEMDLVNEVRAGKNFEEIFNAYKEKITSALSENKDNIPADKVQSLNEQLSQKKFSEDTFCEDIVNLSEIYRILES